MLNASQLKRNSAIDIIDGPQAGAGIGFQATPHLRVALEGDVAVVPFMVATIGLFKLQYTF